MSRLRWGIIGTGWIADKQVSDMTRDGMHVVGVASRSASRAETFAREHGIPRAYVGNAELLADPGIDAVYIATPQARHHEHVAEALRAGKHVLLEKPFTLTAREARDLVELARSRRLALMEAMWSRFLPHLARTKALVDAGAIGPVSLITADSTQALPHGPGDRLGDPAEGGGSLLDLGVYPVSLSSWLLGPPGRTAAHAALSDNGVDLVTVATLAHDGGAIAVCVSGLTGTGPNRAAIVGERGRIEIDGYFYGRSRMRRYDEAGTLQEELATRVAGRGMHLQAREFERIVAAGRLESPVMPLDETVRIMATMDRIRALVGARFPADDVSP